MDKVARTFIEIVRAADRTDNIGMLYPVGTHIDLRYLNDKVVKEPDADRRQPMLYPVGTKILFLNYISELSVLNITRPRMAGAV